MPVIATYVHDLIWWCSNDAYDRPRVACYDIEVDVVCSEDRNYAQTASTCCLLY